MPQSRTIPSQSGWNWSADFIGEESEELVMQNRAAYASTVLIREGVVALESAGRRTPPIERAGAVVR